MRRFWSGCSALVLATALVCAGNGVAYASPAPAPPRDGDPRRAHPRVHSGHERSNPAEEKRRALRAQALIDVATGQRKAVTRGGSTVVKMGTSTLPYSKAELARLQRGQQVRPRTVDQYVELAREDTDRVFVVLAEFGTERHPDFPDRDTDPLTPGPATFEGPLHNAIPAPDRSRNNTTIWQPDYSADYFRTLYFSESSQSLKTYYERQSSGRYSLDGQVTDWVKVRYNEARYGRSTDDPADANGDDPAVCSDVVCDNSEALITDALAQWVRDERAAGRTAAEVRAELATFDRADRYDFDGDGNFSEPDGYLDRLQVLHAGGDEADGDPQQGEDAIWSHRGYADERNFGTTGPTQNPAGGLQIADTNFWVGDYTMQPENGGLSTIAHEYGHDLGLPDHYDIGPDSGDNPAEWWTLMAQSRARAATDVGIGTRPADLGVWDKFQLGWLDFAEFTAGARQTVELGPHEYNTGKKQGLIVQLPDKSVRQVLPTPPQGVRQWWSGSGNGVNHTLTRSVALPAGARAQMTFRANWNIEDCDESACDYAFVEVRNGTAWTPIPGSITNPAEGNGIDGDSDGWRSASFDLTAYAGRTVEVRFRYATDSAVAGQDTRRAAGLFVDDLRFLSGSGTVFSDGAEAGDNGWVSRGFARVGTSTTYLAPHFYLASHRAYVSYDRYLRSGPYNFGWPDRPNRAEFFPYQNGLLVNYWDTSYEDNNTSEHPGQGMILPIDAHPQPLIRLADGRPWRGRIQAHDAPFSLERTDSFVLHHQGRPERVGGLAAQPLFDDTRTYWYAATPEVGVKTPKAGVTMRVLKQQGTSMTVQLGVSPNRASAVASNRR